MDKLKLYIIIGISLLIIGGIFVYGLNDIKDTKQKKEANEEETTTLSEQDVKQLQVLSGIAQDLVGIRISDMYIEDYLSNEERYKDYYSESSIGKYFLIDEEIVDRYHDFKRYNAKLSKYQVEMVKYGTIPDGKADKYAKYGGKYVIYVLVNAEYINLVEDYLSGEEVEDSLFEVDRLFYFIVNKDFKFEAMGDYYEG